MAKVHGLWRHGAGSTNALADAGRLHHQLATAFTVALCGSEAKRSNNFLAARGLHGSVCILPYRILQELGCGQGREERLSINSYILNNKN